MKIKQGSHWYYVGPGDGKGVRHIVCLVDDQLNEVATWSDIAIPINGGYSWLGPKEDFIKHFVNAPPKS